MARLVVKAVPVLNVRVNTLQRDIDDGVMCDITKCMEKVATTRALVQQLRLSPEQTVRLHVKVDAGHIRFNYDGYRWLADTPAKAKNALIQYDKNPAKVKPHSFTIHARRTTQIVPFTDERREQINIARNNRIREGRPDKKYDKATIHQRVVGYAPGY